MENNNSKLLLIKYLSFIRDCELEKPVNEIRIEIVDACIKLLLKLQSKEVGLASEQVKEKVRSIPFVLSADFSGKTNTKVKKYTTKKKILLVAAIIALLAMLLGVCYSVSGDDNFFDDVARIIGLENIEFGKTYIVNGVSYKDDKQQNRYNNAQEYYTDNPYNILRPRYLPEGIKLNKIIISDIDGVNIISISSTNPSYSITIFTNSKIPESTLEYCTETIKQKDKTIHIMSLPDINMYQMYFEYNGDYYEFCYTDKQELLRVIENLEE